jgi:hypothetical protein
LVDKDYYLIYLKVNIISYVKLLDLSDSEVLFLTQQPILVNREQKGVLLMHTTSARPLDFDQDMRIYISAFMQAVKCNQRTLDNSISRTGITTFPTTSVM